MTPFLQLIFILMAILLVAKAAGYLSIKLGQPSVLGQLLAGILLGPTLLDLTHLPIITDTHASGAITHIGEIGVLLLMFLAGLELNLPDLVRNTKVAAFAGTLGVIFPVLMGWGAGLLFGFPGQNALFMGLILGATSVSISAQTLMEMRMLRSRVGLGLLGAAVFDDILVILLLSTVLAVFNGGSSVIDILLIFGRILLYLGASVAIGVYVLPWVSRQVDKSHISFGEMSLALVVTFLYSIAAEVVGQMAAITGAFLAGLMFARTPEKDRIEHDVSALAYGLFVPVFFINIGLGVNLREVGPAAIPLLLAITLVGVLGKIIGSGLGGLLGGFSRMESLQLGAGMVSRGEVGLIVATVGLSNGLVHTDEFSAVIGMVIITTLITPPLLRSLFARSQAADAVQPAAQTGEQERR